MCSALICCRPAPYQSFDSSRLKHSLKNTYTCYTRNNSPWKNPQKRLSRLADPHPAFGSLLASFSSSSQSGCRRSTSGSALLLFPDIKYEHDVTSHKSTGTQNPPKVLLSNPPKKKQLEKQMATTCVRVYISIFLIVQMGRIQTFPLRKSMPFASK